jgi:uroporphyrinogen-III synthase
VVGGIVAALALTWALSRDGGEVSALRAQVDRLQQALAGVEGQSGDVAQLSSRLEALESGSGAAVEQEVRGQIDALKAADAALQERLDALGKSGDQGAAGAQLEDLRTRVDQLESAAAAGGGTNEAATERLTELANKLNELSTTVGQLQQANAGDRSTRAELTSRIEALEGARREVQALNDRLGAIEQRMTAGQEQATGLSDKIVTLGSQVGALSTRVDVLADTVEKLQNQVATREDRRTRAATLALAVPQLEAALEAGEPFEQALDGLRALGPDDPAVLDALKRLDAVASGVPSLPELRSSFDRVANDIVHAAQAPDGDSLIDQAAGNLMRLVTVRPVGADVEGDSAAARVARAEAALARGDLAAAVAELEGLEGAAAAAAAPWLAEAQKRLAAQEALTALQDQATQLLSEAQ